jgi:hypothetical protein
VGSPASPAALQVTSNQVDGRLRQFARDLNDTPSPNGAYSATHDAALCSSPLSRKPPLNVGIQADGAIAQSSQQQNIPKIGDVFKPDGMFNGIWAPESPFVLTTLWEVLAK